MTNLKKVIPWNIVHIGKALVPVMKPAGLGYWQIIVALIGGIAAKEVVVSSCSVLFGIASVNSQVGLGAFKSALLSIGFGPVNAFSLMLFCLLYSPCAAAIATLWRETKSLKWTVVSVIYQTMFAWLSAFIVFSIF